MRAAEPRVGMHKLPVQLATAPFAAVAGQRHGWASCTACWGRLQGAEGGVIDTDGCSQKPAAPASAVQATTGIGTAIPNKVAAAADFAKRWVAPQEIVKKVALESAHHVNSNSSAEETVENSSQLLEPKKLKALCQTGAATPTDGNHSTATDELEEKRQQKTELQLLRE